MPSCQQGTQLPGRSRATRPATAAVSRSRVSNVVAKVWGNCGLLWMVWTQRTRLLERDSSALGLDAPLGGFEDADHAQAGLAVGQRRLAILDALGEVADHRL